MGLFGRRQARDEGDQGGAVEMEMYELDGVVPAMGDHAIEIDGTDLFPDTYSTTFGKDTGPSELIALLVREPDHPEVGDRLIYVSTTRGNALGFIPFDVAVNYAPTLDALGQMPLVTAIAHRAGKRSPWAVTISVNEDVLLGRVAPSFGEE